MCLLGRAWRSLICINAQLLSNSLLDIRRMYVQRVEYLLIRKSSSRTIFEIRQTSLHPAVKRPMCIMSIRCNLGRNVTAGSALKPLGYQISAEAALALLRYRETCLLEEAHRARGTKEEKWASLCRSGEGQVHLDISPRTSFLAFITWRERDPHPLLSPSTE